MRASIRASLGSLGLVAATGAALAAAPAEIVIPGEKLATESLTSSRDGTVYIGVEVGSSASAVQSGQLVAINPNGTPKWTFTTADWIDSAPAIGLDGTVHFGCWDGNFYALRPDRTVKWTYKAGGFIASSAAIAS